ncbi:MAG TPA: hypothetical protein DDX98_11935 [Bacteroidales bacterium]|jgi:hypothetical protein|nr:hypothetical protein [Bacteroidales bacterium]
MKSTNTRYILVIAALFIALVALQHFTPKALNWEMKLGANDKNPYGCIIARQMLAEIFPSDSISDNQFTFYERDKHLKHTGNSFLVITDRFTPDELDINAFLTWVENGNSLFVSAVGFSEKFQKRLNLKLSRNLLDINLRATRNDTLVLKNTISDETNYIFSRALPGSYFTDFPDSVSTVLGTDTQGRANFIKLAFGKGTLYLHMQPLVFTNYHLLYSNPVYASQVLSHLPYSSITWDNYYKPGRLVNTSPVRYILSQPSLRMAYYLVLIFLVLYLVFGGKRKQRVIPVIKPFENTSVNFIKTIARLYYRGKNHKDLANKRFNYFKDFIRERYHIHLNVNEQDSITALEQKSGISKITIENILLKRDIFSGKTTISVKELSNFNDEIEQFYKYCK